MPVKVKYYQVVRMNPQLQLLKDILKVSDIIEATYRQGCSEHSYKIIESPVLPGVNQKLSNFFNNFMDISKATPDIKEISQVAATGFKVGDEIHRDYEHTRKHYTVLEVYPYKNRLLVKSAQDKDSIEVSMDMVKKLTPFYFINSDGAIIKSYIELDPKKYAVAKVLGREFDTMEDAQKFDEGVRDKISEVYRSLRQIH